MSFELPLSEIYNVPCLTDPIKEYLIEACLLVLSYNAHDITKPITISIVENEVENFKLILDKGELSEITQNGWEIDHATEKAAEYIALIMCNKMTGYQVIKRSIRGTGFDYWLGLGDITENIFHSKARLEISGILKGDLSSVKNRFEEKSKQTDKSDNFEIPAYISVTAFAKPFTQFNLKNNQRYDY